MTTELRDLPIHLVKPPRDAHRLDFDKDALIDLAADIRANGLVNRIQVRPDAGFYEIIAGHRRYLAHKMLNAETIAAEIYTDADDERTERMRFAENLQRADLSPMEEAIAIARMQDATGDPLDALAKKLSRSTAWVRNRLDLLALPDDLKDLVHTRTLTISHANLLCRVTDTPQRNQMTRYIVDSGANAEITKAWVHEWERNAAAARDPDDTLPPLPPPPTEITVMLPCAICGERHDHRQLHIARTCATCNAALRQTRGN